MTLDPQALVLAPESVVEISNAIVSGGTYVEAAVMGAEKALDLIEKAWKEGSLALEEREAVYIDMIRSDLARIPADEGAFVEMVMPSLDPERVILSEYGL